MSPLVDIVSMGTTTSAEFSVRSFQISVEIYTIRMFNFVPEIRVLRKFLENYETIVLNVTTVSSGKILVSRPI